MGTSTAAKPKAEAAEREVRAAEGSYSSLVKKGIARYIYMADRDKPFLTDLSGPKYVGV